MLRLQMSSGDQNPIPRRPRKSAFSCEACRKRKVKCDGSTPKCSRCSTRGASCVYRLTPTLGYTRSLEKRIAELEAQLSKTLTLARERSEEKGSLPSPTNQLPTYESPEQSSSADGERSEILSENEHPILEHDRQINFHDPTSFFELPQGRQDQVMVSSSLAVDSGSKERLILNAWRERAFEKLANTPEPVKSLLESHWTWIQPLFNFVYRPAFTRDMKSGGPYYSPTLLYAILSHSVRWAKSDPRMSELLEPYDGGVHFSRWAVEGLFTEIRQGDGKVPDVQALLLLSAQACSSGQRTQAWLYCGMAFRLIQSMGLNIDGKKFAGAASLSDEDIEIRKRLFWSCHCWEKLLCLYLGKSPTILSSPVSPPHTLLDDSAEIDIWSPSGVTLPGGDAYPPTQNHATSCFTNMCTLSEILNRVLIHLYDPGQHRDGSSMQEYSIRESARLEEWWNDLPNFLQISVENPPEHCPPSHIATLNCLFYTIVILLHRRRLGAPFPSAERDKMDDVKKCVSSANSIIKVFELYRRTFGESRVVLALGYCVYTAASVFLLEAQAVDRLSNGIISQLRFCLDVLERLKLISPIINTALRLIYQEMQRLNLSIDLPSEDQCQFNIESTDSEEKYHVPDNDVDPLVYDWGDVDIDTSLLLQWGGDEGTSSLAATFDATGQVPAPDVIMPW